MELSTDRIGPQAEFQCSHRRMLLRNLKDALGCDLPPTAWACIWLADIERLESSIAAIHQDPGQLSMNRAFLVNTDIGIVVRQCAFHTAFPHRFFGANVSISRVSTTSLEIDRNKPQNHSLSTIPTFFAIDPTTTVDGKRPARGAGIRITAHNINNNDQHTNSRFEA